MEDDGCTELRVSDRIKEYDAYVVEVKVSDRDVDCEVKDGECAGRPMLGRTAEFEFEDDRCTIVLTSGRLIECGTEADEGIPLRKSDLVVVCGLMAI